MSVAKAKKIFITLHNCKMSKKGMAIQIFLIIFFCIFITFNKCKCLLKEVEPPYRSNACRKSAKSGTQIGSHGLVLDSLDP